MTDFGIDISHHNRVDNWQAVRGNNITYVSIKLTESTAFSDPAAAGHADRARAVGIRAGGYHFARRTPVSAQVQHFAARIRELGLDGPDAMAPVLDMEAAELRSSANAFVADFIRELRSVTGIRRVLVYANLDWLRNVLRPSEWLDENVLLWIARYNGNPGHPGFGHPNLALHQHTDRGRVPGIPGNVDRDATLPGFGLADLLIGDRGPAADVLLPADEEAAGIPAPRDLVGVGKPDNTIELTWQPVDGDGVTYTLYETDSPTGVRDAGALTTTSSVRGPFTRLRTFRYWVTARRNGQESPISNVVAVHLPIDEIEPEPGPLAPTGRTPAEVLDIGRGSSQNHFNVGIGYGPSHDGEHKHTDKSQSDIVGGFTDAPFFTVNSAGTAVQFQVFMDGGKTSPRTKFPRSELREFEANGTTKAAWNARQGTHVMEGRTRVLHLQPKRPWVTIAQIHDKNKDTLGIKVKGDSTGALKVVAVTDTSAGDAEKTLLDSYELGSEISWRIQVRNDELTVSINGALKLTLQHFSSDNDHGQYFKAGAYPQSRMDAGGNEKPEEFCRVELRGLRVTHD